jgi:hypothetical protein
MPMPVPVAATMPMPMPVPVRLYHHLHLIRRSTLLLLQPNPLRTCLIQRIPVLDLPVPHRVVRAILLRQQLVVSALLDDLRPRDEPTSPTLS